MIALQFSAFLWVHKALKLHAFTFLIAIMLFALFCTHALTLHSWCSTRFLTLETALLFSIEKSAIQSSKRTDGLQWYFIQRHPVWFLLAKKFCFPIYFCVEIFCVKLKWKAITLFHVFDVCNRNWKMQWANLDWNCSNSCRSHWIIKTSMLTTVKLRFACQSEVKTFGNLQNSLTGSGTSQTKRWLK